MSDMDLDTLRERWDTFAPMFAERMEPRTLQLARVLAAQLFLQDAKAVLEVGAGAGGAAQVLWEAMSDDARLVVTDLSPAMLEIARSVLPPEVEVMEANAEALQFEDASFDRYLANLNVMLVPDPDRALDEATRVLQPGGLAAWSVWGRPEHSLMFTIPPQAAERVGIQLPEVPRSNFHMGDRDAFRERVRERGFDRVLAWYSPLTLDLRSGLDLANTLLETPRWQESLEGVPAEKVAALRLEIARQADASLDAGVPVGLEALMVVARKAGAD